jgi:hypothetical protein
MFISTFEARGPATKANVNPIQPSTPKLWSLGDERRFPIRQPRKFSLSHHPGMLIGTFEARGAATKANVNPVQPSYQPNSGTSVMTGELRSASPAGLTPAKSRSHHPGMFIGTFEARGPATNANVNPVQPPTA